MAVFGTPFSRIRPRYMPSQFRGVATSKKVQTALSQISRNEARKLNLPLPSLSRTMTPPTPPSRRKSSTATRAAVAMGSPNNWTRRAIVDAVA